MPGLEGVVLHRLYLVTTPQTAAEVHRRAGAGSLNGVRYALDRLADQGIVTTVRVGRSLGYRLNTDHVVYGAVVAAFEALDPWGVLSERLERLAAQRFPGRMGEGTSVTLAIYGSVARGEAGAHSDVDVLLVLPDAGADTARAADDLTDDLHRWVPRWTGNDAHVFRITATALADGARHDEPIAASWARDAITVAGRNVREIMAGRP
jgi:predicted nucleotidyltransferase